MATDRQAKNVKSVRKSPRHRLVAARRTLLLEALEQRTLLSITPRLVPGGVSFVGDGASDVLALRADPTNRLAYSVDGSPFSTDLGGGQQLSLASPFAIAVDLGAGDDRLEVDASLRAVLDSGGGTLNDEGGGGINTLSAGDTDSVWSITGMNAGHVGGIVFTGVQNLVGGQGQDTFVLADQAGVDGTIDGGGGYNVLDYSAYTTQVSADLNLGLATGAGSVRNIQDATGLPSASLTGVPQWQPVGPNGTTSGDSSSDGTPTPTEPGSLPGVGVDDSVGPTQSTGGPVEGMQAQGSPVSGAVMNPARADKLLAGSGHTFAELLALVDSGKPVPGFPLASRIKASVTVERAEVQSQNVAGILRGSDPKRRDEYVVLSAHLDHLGIGEPINGDRIYNGAMDNASGVAAILEVAARLHKSGVRPARSILFLAVTGEEKGELGSRYFAANPTVPRGSIVANVNTDMFLPLFPLKILMVLGLDESDLGKDIQATAKELGLEVQADPEPQRNRFVRSDQYSFIKAGIPALAMKVGYKESTPESAIAATWTKERYHAPSDDLDQPVDLQAADKYVDTVLKLAVRIANRADKPMWYDSSFFKLFEKGK